jgi:hypothetical protein
MNVHLSIFHLSVVHLCMERINIIKEESNEK